MKTISTTKLLTQISKITTFTARFERKIFSASLSAAGWKVSENHFSGPLSLWLSDVCRLLYD
jgi:hypothetical protein